MAYKTQQEIYNELLIEYPVLTKNDGGSTTPMSEQERLDTIQIWSQELFDKQTPDNAFLVQPENFYLKITKDAENEFSKLITLLNLGIQQNTFTSNSPIQIWDYYDNPVTLTIERFLQIMVSYGLYCYINR